MVLLFDSVLNHHLKRENNFLRRLKGIFISFGFFVFIGFHCDS